MYRDCFKSIVNEPEKETSPGRLPKSKSLFPIRSLPLLVILFLVVTLPISTQAAVFINEIAWMGNTSDANDEWIELINTGASTIDISEWTLIAADDTPSITLSGSISAGGFFLLERTNDESVPGISADQIYVGALGNGGETLTLKDSSGSTIDQAVGGDDWENLGGDNVTKQTAQKTTSGWTTAVATPRAANTGGVQEEPETPPEDTEDEPAVETSTSTGGISMEVITPPRFFIDIDAPHTVAAGAATTFSAEVYDDRGRIRDDASITWSFGEGTRRTGASVLHTFYEAGEYSVFVKAVVLGGDEKEQFIVTAKWAGISIVGVTERGITINNSANTALNLSFWRLSSGGKEFKIPEDTYLLSGRAVTFSSKVTGLSSSESALLKYPSGEVAAAYPNISTQAQVQPTPSPVRFKEVQTAASVEADILNEIVYEKEFVAPAASTSVLAAGAAFAEKGNSPLTSSWTLWFFALVAFFAGALIVARRYG